MPVCVAHVTSLAALIPKATLHCLVQVLSNDGLLAGKTRVLVTHADWCLRHADLVVVMERGRVRARGSLDELTADDAVSVTSYTTGTRNAGTEVSSTDGGGVGEAGTRLRRASSAASEGEVDDGVLVAEESVRGELYGGCAMLYWPGLTALSSPSLLLAQRRLTRALSVAAPTLPMCARQAAFCSSLGS